ncbi:MAG TPA: spore germination protein GerPC [Bacillota bacterium]|nr:spore germination protein GerPC [Bacillota bacterium]
MNWNQYMDYYMRQLHASLYSQNRQIEQLKQSIDKLQKEINQLSEKITPSVVRNEYKFDLLKVEKLEGTLNIGLNPNSKDSSIGELDVSQSLDVSTFEKQNPECFKKIQQQINEYLCGEAYQYLMSIEQQYGCQLGDDYRKFILDDVKKQIDQRIRYYLSQHPCVDPFSNEQLQQIEQSVINRVIADINKSCEAFLHNLPKEGWS